jgi:GH15 family glucan-1,4-alpha-glucosidase
VIGGLLHRGDQRADRLIDATLGALESWPYLYRYEPGGDDGFAGHEGAFVPASWWAVSALAVVGRVDEAEDRANQLCAGLPALLPEEVDPVSGEGRGNVPLLWSHMEAARALYLLEVATLRKRYRSIGLACWSVAQYGRLRRRRAVAARHPDA